MLSRDVLLQEVLSQNLVDFVEIQAHTKEELNPNDEVLKEEEQEGNKKKKQANYVAETLPNLHHCILWVTIPSENVPFVEKLPYGVGVEGPKLRVSWFQRAKGEEREPLDIFFSKGVELPDPFSFKVVGPSDYTEIQLTVPPLTKSSTLFAEAFRSASSTDKLSSSNSFKPPVDVMRSLHCRSCGSEFSNQLTQSVQFTVKLMPSAHWVELSDLWVCYGPQHFQQFPREKLNAQENTVIVDEVTVVYHHDLVSKENLKWDTVKDTYSTGHEDQTLTTSSSSSSSGGEDCCSSHKPTTSNSQTRSADFVSCARCDSLVGELDRDSQEIELCGFKFYKHKITTSLGPSLNWFRYETTETRCAQSILSAAKSHGRYRVCVADSVSRKLSFLINILNWNIALQSNVFEESDEFNGKMRPVIKLGWIDCAKTSPTLFKKVREWKENKASEIVLFHSEEIEVLRTLLYRSNKAYPPAFRKMQDYQIGFLCLNREPQI